MIRTTSIFFLFQIITLFFTPAVVFSAELINKTLVGRVSGNASQTIISGDGYHYATVEAKGGAEGWFKDGRAMGSGPAGYLKFHPLEEPNSALNYDGSKLAYLHHVFDSAGNKKGVSLSINGSQVGREYQNAGRLTFSPKGSRLAYAALAGNIWRVVENGRPGPRLGNKMPYKILFSPDDSNIAYSATVTDGETYLFINHKPTVASVAYHWTFSPSWDRIAYKNFSSNEVFIDDASIGKFEDIQKLKFTPDGKSLSFSQGSMSGYRAIIDGRPMGNAHKSSLDIIFSPRTNTPYWVSMNKNRKYDLYAAGKVQAGGWDSSLGSPRIAFSPKGLHYAYGYKKGGRSHLSVDGKVTQGMPALWYKAKIVFDNETEFHYLSISRSRAYLICGSVGPAPPASQSLCAKKAASAY